MKIGLKPQNCAKINVKKAKVFKKIIQLIFKVKFKVSDKLFKDEPTALNLARLCRLPKKIGSCEARITRWYYNAKTKRCTKFFYGGCQGNVFYL